MFNTDHFSKYIPKFCSGITKMAKLRIWELCQHWLNKVFNMATLHMVSFSVFSKGGEGKDAFAVATHDSILTKYFN